MVLNSQALINARTLVEARLPSSFLPPSVTSSAAVRAHPTPITHIVPLPDAHKVSAARCAQNAQQSRFCRWAAVRPFPGARPPRVTQSDAPSAHHLASCASSALPPARLPRHRAQVLTCSRDGTLALWDGAELRLERVFPNAMYLPRGHSTRSPFNGGTNDPWISAVLHAPERSTVLIGTADRNVLLYDASSWEANRFVPYGRLQLPNEPTIIALAHAALQTEAAPVAPTELEAAQQRRAVDPFGMAAPMSLPKRQWRTALVIGDARGDVSAYDLNAACQFARALYPEAPVRMPKLAPVVKLAAVHTDWVTEAQYIASSDARVQGGGGSLATCSLDRTIALSDLDTCRVKARLSGHSKPVLSLAYLPAVDMLASCGLGARGGGVLLRGLLARTAALCG